MVGFFRDRLPRFLEFFEATRLTPRKRSASVCSRVGVLRQLVPTPTERMIWSYPRKVLDLDSVSKNSGGIEDFLRGVCFSTRPLDSHRSLSSQDLPTRKDRRISLRLDALKSAKSLALNQGVVYIQIPYLSF